MKVGRAFGHGVADVASIGLWEVFGTPAEAYFNGKETTYEVTYDEDDLVKSYKLIDFNQAFPKVKEQCGNERGHLAFFFLYKNL